MLFVSKSREESIDDCYLSVMLFYYLMMMKEINDSNLMKPLMFENLI